MPTSASSYFILFSYSFITHGDTDNDPHASRPRGLSSHGAWGQRGGGTTETMTMAADSPASKVQRSLGWGGDPVGNCKAQDLVLDLQLPGKKVDNEVGACSSSSGKVDTGEQTGLIQCWSR